MKKASEICGVVTLGKRARFCDGCIRTSFLSDSVRESWDDMPARSKAAFDPHFLRRGDTIYLDMDFMRKLLTGEAHL
jgi:hypothetical protein